jgi:DNA repair protein RadC
MPLIKEIHSADRPYERAFSLGVESLANAELLAIIIGNGVRGKSSLDLAYELLTTLGDDGIHLFSDRFKRAVEAGLSKVKRLRLLASLELFKRGLSLSLEKISLDFEYEPSLIYLHFLLTGGINQHEHFAVYSLSKGEKIERTCLIKGTYHSLKIDSDHFFSSIKDAKKIVIIHNHLDGECDPSLEDIARTEKMDLELKKRKIVLLDHLIASSRGFYSFLNNKIVLSN